MQATNAIQNAMINTTTGAQVGMVVDAANAHRSYLRIEFPSGARPDSKRPHFGVSDAHSPSDVAIDLKQRLPLNAGRTSENGPRATCHDSGSSWRFDNRQLPGAAWAMLVLSRSLCG